MDLYHLCYCLTIAARVGGSHQWDTLVRTLACTEHQRGLADLAQADLRTEHYQPWFAGAVRIIRSGLCAVSGA